MTSLGAASIELSLDRSRFDRDLAQLSQENAPSLTPKLKLDVKDFNNQIAGLQGFIPPISVPVTLDTSSIRVADVRRQFSDIGRNAALGFAEGFAGADKGIESTIDSLVKNAKSQLEIQSPSRVFRQIGKYAADGLVQGLQDIDKASLKGFVNEVEDYFKRTKIELYPDTEGFEKKIRGVTSKKYSTTIGLDDDNFSDKIEKSFEKALKRVEGKGFGSNLMSAIAAPLKFAGGLLRESLSGAFLGVGLPIGEQLGHGLAKGVESQVSGIIGSVDVLGERIAKRLPEAINSKIKQVPLLNSIFSSQQVTDAQKNSAKFLREQVVGQDEVRIESLSLTTRNRDRAAIRKKQAAEEAGRQYDRAIVDAPKDSIVEQIRIVATKQAAARQDAAQKELTDFVQSKDDLVKAAKPKDREKVRQQNILQEAVLTKNVEQAAIETARSQSQLRASRSRPKIALGQLNAIGVDVSSVTVAETALAQIRTKGKEQTEKLVAELKKLYADRQTVQSALESALNANDKEAATTEFKRSKVLNDQINKTEQQFKKYTAAYKQSIIDAKAEIADSRAQLIQSTAFPQKSVDQVASTIAPRQKINLIGYQASTGTQIELSEGQRKVLAEDLKKQIESVGGEEGRKKIEAIRESLTNQEKTAQDAIKSANSKKKEALGKPQNDAVKNFIIAAEQTVKTQAAAIRQIRSRLEIANTALRPMESLELQIKELDSIIEPAKKQQKQIEEIVKKKAEKIDKAEEILAQRSKGKPKQLAKPNATYAKIVQSAAAIAGLDPIPENLIPKLESSEEVAGRGDYNARSNTYRLRPDLYKQLQTNDIDKISEETVGNILHEIYHAFQHGFGQAIADKTGKPSVELQPASEELLKLGGKIESSVAIQPDSRQSLSRKLETDANVFQLRNTSQVTDSLRREQYSQQALSLGGVAGSKISLTEVNKVIDQVQGFIKEAQTLGADIKEDRDRLFNQIKNIRSTADTVGAKSVDLQALSAEEIKGIVSEYQRLLKEVEKIKKEVPILQASLTPVSSSSPKTDLLVQPQEIKDPWLEDSEKTSLTPISSSNLKDDLLIQLQKPQLKRIAKDLGVSGVSTKNKPEIVDSILQSGASEDAIRAKLPKFRIPTEEIIKNATEVSQLTSSELIELTQETINEVASVLKSIKASPAGSEKLANLQNLLREIDELELIYIAAKTKVLDEELKNTLEGRIKSVQKQRVATIFEMKPLQPGVAAPLQTFDQQPNSIREAEIEFERRNLDGEDDLQPKAAIEKAKPIGSSMPRDTIPTLSFDAGNPNNFSRINQEYRDRQLRNSIPIPSLQNFTGFVDSDESRSLVVSDRQNSLPNPLYTPPKEELPSLSFGLDDGNPNDFTRLNEKYAIEKERERQENSSLTRPTTALDKFKPIGYSTPRDTIPTLSFEDNDPNDLTRLNQEHAAQKAREEGGLPKESTSLVVRQPTHASFPEDTFPSISFWKDEPRTVTPTEDLGPDLNLDSKQVASRIQELSDRVKQSSRAIEKSVKAQEKRYAKTVNNNIDKNSRIVDTALEQLEKDANAETAGIQANIEYQDGLSNRRLRRNARRVQQKYGLEDTLAPQVETPLVEPKSTALSLKSIFGDLRQNGIQATRKQAIALNQQAQILLADIQTQLTVGNNAQKESELLQKQVAENEKALNKILNTIKRASEGKQPELTPGDLQRLSGRAQTLGEQIDEGKEKLALNKSAIAAGKELRPVTERLVTAASNSQNILSKGVVSDKDLTDLRKYNQEIKELFGLLGEPPIPPSNIFEQLTQNVGGLGKAAFTAVKGFLAFQGLISLQNFLSSAGQEAFKTYVEFDKLKTALNFASGGSGVGANNLTFVKKQVEDLAIPLTASIKGFTQLAGAARGTSLEGQPVKELFTGVSQASTVLSLSAEDTEGAIAALEKILSEGKASSEALREELGNRIPGAFAIAARATGVTEEEFTRLLETGQVLSQDFLPKFGKQLQSEFGAASKTASDNAQSAIFKLQNSWQSLQQTVGEGVAPAVIPGLKLLSGTLGIIADHVRDLLAIAASVALVLSFNLGNALKTVLTNLILTNAATGTLGGGFQFLAQQINNSLSVKIGAAIFGVIEIIKLLNDQVNTDLVKSFDEAANAALRAAKASEEVFDKQNGNPRSKQDEDEPRATSDTGKFVDDFLIKPTNYALQHTFTNIPKLATTGESEKARSLDSETVQEQATTLLLSGAKLREAEIKRQSGPLGQLPALDKTLRDRSIQQQILQAQVKRDYTDKGFAIPANIQTKLIQESFQINQLNNKRGDIAQPYNETLAALNQGITRYKSQLEGLKDQKTIDNLGAAKIDELTKKYNQNIEALLKQKNSLEATLAAYNVNPILKFNAAFRSLNLTLNETTEANQIVTTKREIGLAQARLQGFSTNRLAGRQSALTDAITARDSASADAQNQQKILEALNKEARSPALQPQLQRLGITPDSSAAKIQDIINNTKDESDKTFLEKIKSVREQEIKTLGAKKTSVESQEKVKQVTQDNALSELQFGAGGATAAIQKRESLNTAAIRKAQEDRTITETEAAEKIARIQVNSTASQQKSVAVQLRLLNEYHRQGIVGAEEFATRQRDLTTEQTNLQKQSAEQQLAVFDAMNRRKLEQLELANKKAEAAIALSQTLATTGVKQGVLDSNLDPQEAAKRQNLIDQQASIDRVEFIKKEIAQTAALRANKVLSAKEATEKELDLNQQLAAANQQLVDQQVQGQELLKARIEKTFERRKQQLDLLNTQASSSVKRGVLDSTLDSIEAPKQQNLVEQRASLDRIEFIKSELEQTRILRDRKIISAREATDKQLAFNQELATVNQQLIDQQIQAQEQLRAAVEKTFQRRKDQSELEISQANTGVQQGYLDQFSAPEIDEKGLDLARTGVTLNNSSVSASRQINLLQEQLAGVDKLGYAEKDAADKKRSLLSEIEKLRQQQIQTEIDLIKNKEEIEINGIERVQKVEENRFRLASSNLEQQKSSLELYNASLDRTAKLEESRTNLQKAVSDAGLSGLDIRKQSADRALELSRRLKNDSNLDPSVANEINRQLSQAGFGTNELDILKRRQQIEDEIAAKKLDALKIEQEFQRKSLVLDLKRQQIAAQTAVYDAESSRIAAEKSKLEADNALRIAQIKRDPVEIQIAKVGVELADRDIDLSSRKLQNAKDNLGVQDELARNSVLTQEATQRSAIGQQLAADSARKMAGSLERAEASTTKMASESKTSDKASSDIFAQKPGEGLFAYNLRINQAKAFGQIVEKKDSHWDAGAGFTLATSTAIPVGDGSRVDTALDRQMAIAPTVKDTVSDALASSKIKVASSTSGYDQFAEALRSANKGIESRLDKLLDSFTATMNAPKSLTVLSPNPVDDAAKIYNDMSRDMVRSSGL